MTKPIKISQEIIREVTKMGSWAEVAISVKMAEMDLGLAVNKDDR